MMSRLGYDVITPGERELRPGLATLMALYAKHPEIQVVSANLQDKSGRRIFPEYTIVERGGVRFGITGTTGAVYYESNRKQNLQAKDDFTFESSEAALRRVVAELKPKCDVIVALLHEQVSDGMDLVTKVPGVDIAIAGNAPGIVPVPEQLGGTLYVRPGSRGQYVYKLPISVDKSAKKIVEFAGDAKLLDEKVPKEAEIDFVVAKWDNEFKARNKPAAAAAPTHK